MMDRWMTRKTRKTSYVSIALKSLWNLSRVRTEKRYEERVSASRISGFSRFVGRLFSCAKAPKYGFTRFSRFSRASLHACVHSGVERRARDGH